MGYSQSKIQDEDSVSRCRQQMQFIKQVMKSRNAFALAHASYLQALCTTGSAFQKFAEGQLGERANLVSLPPQDPPSNQSCTGLPGSMILPPMALINTPLLSETVVLSPPTVIMQSPLRASSDKLDQDYFFNQSPTFHLYESMQQYASSSLAHDPGSPPPSALHTGAVWDWFDLFESPSMAMHLQQQRRYKEMREGEGEQIVEEEIPSLETEENFMNSYENIPGGGNNPEENYTNCYEKVPGAENNPEEPQNMQQKSEETVQNCQKIHPDTVKEEEITEDPMPDQKLGNPQVQEIGEQGELALMSESSDEKVESEIKIASPKEKDLPEVLRIIYEQFTKASESAHDVSRILEANKQQHQHPTFQDSKGFSEQSSKSMPFCGFSWMSWPPKTPKSWTEWSDGSTACEETVTEQSHASTLDKVYAWEKKLYEEVKAVELINTGFEKKRKMLLDLDAKGGNFNKIDRTRGSIKTLETQMMVTYQAMEASSASIKKITDDEIYIQLLELLQGLASMWKLLFNCHSQQKAALSAMKTPEKLPLESTGIFHRQVTIELEAALNNWQLMFGNSIRAQREYIQNLTGWLRLSWFKPDRESKKASAARKLSPTYYLCRDWHAQLSQLSEKPTVDAIRKFSASVGQVIKQQTEEQRIHKRAEALAKDLSKRILNLNQEEKKLSESITSQNQNAAAASAILSEKRQSLAAFRKVVATEKENFIKAIEKTRAFTLECLEKGLPELFQALHEFAAACAEAYSNLFLEVKDGKLRQDHN